MKKLLMAAVAATLVFTACEKQKKAAEPAETVTNNTTAVAGAEVKTATLVVENTISADKQYMFNKYGKDYRFFESQIVLKNYLNKENDGSIESITNVFQVVDMTEDQKSADVFVVLITHKLSGETIYDVKEGFWIEDELLNDEAITVKFTQAYANLMATNFPKPFSKHVVLRKEVGSKEANAQFIFGNTHLCYYVDAVTGAVSDKNPAFENIEGFKAPLGEWP